MNFEEIRAYLYEFANSDVGTITFFVVAFVILFFTSISFLKYKKEVKLLKKVNQIKDMYDEAVKLPIDQQLAIIEKIGKFNAAYAQIYVEKNKIYNNLKLIDIDPFNDEISKLENELKTRKRKKIEKTINNYFVKVQALSEKVMNFYFSLKEVTKEDEDARSRAFKVRESLRECRALYNKNQDALCYNEKVFMDIFDDIDSSFIRFDEYLDQGKFDQANDLLGQLEDTIFRLKEDLTQMPKIAAFATQVLPKRLNEVIDTYNYLRGEGYPLHSLRITNTINDIKNELATIKEQLNFLEYEGLGELCHELSESIEVVRVKLQKEKNARNEFDKNCNYIYHEVEDLERRFIKIKRGSADIYKIYKPEDAYTKLLDDLQHEISVLSMYKRDLDTYIHSSTPQPYSILLEKLKILDQQKKVVNTMVDEYSQFITDMKNEVEEIYESCMNYTLRVKECESSIIDCNVESFYLKYQDRTSDLLSKLYQLRQTVLTQPIDVVEARKILLTVEPIIEDYFEEVDEQLSYCRYAERAIIFANQYYGDFKDVRNVVDRAEVHFANAEFAIAMDITIEIIEKLQPGVYNHKLSNT